MPIYLKLVKNVSVFIDMILHLHILTQNEVNEISFIASVDRNSCKYLFHDGE